MSKRNINGVKYGEIKGTICLCRFDEVVKEVMYACFKSRWNTINSWKRDIKQLNKKDGMFSILIKPNVS